MKRKIDKNKKSNIKCEHCANWICCNGIAYCSLTASKTNYWNRCKHFEWAKGLAYKEIEYKEEEKMKKKYYECDGGSLAIGSADLYFNVINCFGDGRHAVEVYERSRANHNRKLVFRGTVSGSEIKVYDYDCLSKAEREDPAHTLFTLSGRYGIYAVEGVGTIILEKWN